MEPPRPSGLHRLLGESEAAERVRRFARRAAANDAPVLVTGETGTGKGVLARAIHECSGRARRPFVSVNCAGVPETLFESAFFGHGRGAFTGAVQAQRGFFEQASGGTLFLDEVAELPLGLQAKLLSAVEDGEVRRIGSERPIRIDVRLVAATNLVLEHAVAAGRFRADLYHRLLVLGFRVPPLRERFGDIDYFAHLFLGRYTERYRSSARGFEPAATARIHAHAWPGNIRELAHAVEAAVIACDRERIRLGDLPEHVRAPGAAPVPFGATSPETQHAGAPVAGVAASRRLRYSHYGSEEDERRRIRAALEACRGNKTRAAERLGMARNTLRNKLHEYGLAETSR